MQRRGRAGASAQLLLLPLPNPGAAGGAFPASCCGCTFQVAHAEHVLAVVQSKSNDPQPCSTLLQDVGQETDLLVRAFRLPWTVAASWMAHSSPNAELLPGAGAGVGGGTPSSADRSSFTGEYHTRPPYNEVLGPTDTSSDLSSGARRALLRSAASPALHDRFMATVCGGGSSEPQPATAGLGMPAAATPASDDPAPVAVAPVPANGVPAPDSEGSAGSSAASLAGSHAAELAHEEARLLAEAASWGAEAEADRCGGCVVSKCLHGSS